MDTVETRTVAKVQRSTQLPSDIFRLIDAFEGRNGAKFNRQNLAAFLMYFFSDPQGVSNDWMKAAVAVERGDLNVGDVPKWLAERELEDVRNRLQEAKEDEEIGCPASPEELRELGERASELTNTIMGWENILRLADDPIDAVLTFWKRVDSGTLPFEITNAPQESLDQYKKKPGEDVQPSN